MSGHSKWAGIKHKRAIVDAKRGQAFTKVAAELSVAAREGGDDPVGNFRLRLAIQKAREVNMPADNIERAIQRGAGGKDGVKLEEVRYEGYGPHGVAVMLDVLTDNRNRTVAATPNLFEEARRQVEEAGYTVEEAEVTMNPGTSITLDAPQARQVLRLLDSLEELDDVQQVYANAEIPDEVLESVTS